MKRLFEMGRGKYEKFVSDATSKFDEFIMRYSKLEEVSNKFESFIPTGALEGSFNSGKKTFEGVISESIWPTFFFVAAQTGSGLLAYKVVFKDGEMNRLKNNIKVEDELSKKLTSDVSACHYLTHRYRRLQVETECQRKLSKLIKEIAAERNKDSSA